MRILAAGSPEGGHTFAGLLLVNFRLMPWMRQHESGQRLIPLTRSRPGRGFTLLELLVVLAIIAIGSAGVGLALRDSSQTRLEREALRLGALLESARARSQVGGAVVRWRVTAAGFRFEPTLATQEEPLEPLNWLDPDTGARVERPAGAQGQPAGAEPDSLVLGPDPIIAPQVVVLYSIGQPAQQLRLATDGVRPFAVPAVTP